MPADYQQLLVESRAQWRSWLQDQHATAPGVWAVTWKKGRSGPHVPYADLVEEALCFGWIDSLGRKVDDERSQLLLTPRKPASKWSRLNKQRVARLTAAGLMAPAGLAMVELAQRTGTWTALDLVEDLVEPAELRAALDAVPAARRHWDGFPRSARRAILEWIGSARTDQTRDKRVRKAVEEAAVGRRANQPRQPRSAGTVGDGT
jgi:uncharacterized protein YdeI (YjbR/CyaY-like superfamily)